jgi:hypothetical protein
VTTVYNHCDESNEPTVYAEGVRVVKLIKVAALATALASIPQANAETVNLTEMRCGAFNGVDRVRADMILAWFMGFYSEVRDPQTLDIDKMNEYRQKIILFCQGQPDFRITTAAEGIIGK